MVVSGSSVRRSVLPGWPFCPPVFLPDVSRRLLARGFLVQSVAGRRFAAVAAVQAKAAFQFSDAGSERRDDLPLRAVLFQQCRDDLAKRRRLAGRCAIIGVGMGIGRWKRHRELDSCPESPVKRRSAARYLGCYKIQSKVGDYAGGMSAPYLRGLTTAQADAATRRSRCPV